MAGQLRDLGLDPVTDAPSDRAPVHERARTCPVTPGGEMTGDVVDEALALLVAPDLGHQGAGVALVGVFGGVSHSAARMISASAAHVGGP